MVSTCINVISSTNPRPLWLSSQVQLTSSTSRAQGFIHLHYASLTQMFLNFHMTKTHFNLTDFSKRGWRWEGWGRGWISRGQQWIHVHGISVSVFPLTGLAKCEMHFSEINLIKFGGLSRLGKRSWKMSNRRRTLHAYRQSNFKVFVSPH